MHAVFYMRDPLASKNKNRARGRALVKFRIVSTITLVFLYFIAATFLFFHNTIPNIEFEAFYRFKPRRSLFQIAARLITIYRFESSHRARLWRAKLVPLTIGNRFRYRLHVVDVWIIILRAAMTESKRP